MKIALTVNGRPVEAEVAPRTSLADLLREELRLTGTHLGCEHGICGACTVEIDGGIARSCITYAVACDGARVRTVEGFDDDALMVRLRRAFAQAHALQCGYCTPGMLVAARDLVRRKGGLTRAEIRHEMSGNLCRCTGYTGIVDAIQRVIDEEGVRPCGSDPMARPSTSVNARWLGPAPGPPTAPEPGVRPAGPDPAAPASPPSAPMASGKPVPVTTGKIEESNGVVRLSQSFTLEHPRAAVWALMSDVQAVAQCMPGAQLDGPPQDGKVTGRIEVRLGPVAASFAGEGIVTALPAEYHQVIEGRGVDRKGGSRVSGSVDYRLVETAGADGGAATRVDVVIGYALTGLLAQFGKSALARDVAQRIGEAFAQAIAARLSPGSAGAEGTLPEVRLNVVSLVLAAAWARLRAIVDRLFPA